MGIGNGFVGPMGQVCKNDELDNIKWESPDQSWNLLSFQSKLEPIIIPGPKTWICWGHLVVCIFGKLIRKFGFVIGAKRICYRGKKICYRGKKTLESLDLLSG